MSGGCAGIDIVAPTIGLDIVAGGGVDVLDARPAVELLEAAAPQLEIARELRVVELAGVGARGEQGPPGPAGGGLVGPFAFSYGDAPGNIYTPSVAGTITEARVIVTTPFDGVGASLTLGTASEPNSIMATADSFLGELAEFEKPADKPINAGEGIRLSITPGSSATQGAGLIYLTFIES